ncbi:MAG: hypothetical protein H6748_09415 [Spirochaetaceae bacterium]|nr:hypothetical protein [Spirochaetaceae bacterium]
MPNRPADRFCPPPPPLRPFDPRGRGLRRLAAALVGLGLLAVGSASADGAGAPLAPPGPCAEPREARSGSALGAGSSLVGPLEALFAPADVAAAPAVGLAGPPRPATSQLIRPGACDVPGSGGCGLPGGGAIRENPPARPDRPAP